jgi:benzil reductase ((S)-benzoin forming)
MRLLLLTGASRGIGRAIGEAAAQRGFEVIEFSRTGRHPGSVRTDLSSPLAAKGIIDARISSIDATAVDELLVISNAATLEPIGPVHRKAAADIAANLNTNIASAVLFCASAIAHFQQAPCRKVLANISAGVGGGGVFGWSLYCASKAAMDTFIRTVAAEQASEQYPFVAVNVDPGVVNTDMHAVAGAVSSADFPASRRFAERRDKGQLTPPQEAASAIVRCLLSPSLEQGVTYDARDIEAT